MSLKQKTLFAASAAKIDELVNAFTLDVLVYDVRLIRDNPLFYAQILYNDAEEVAPE